jgi:hypothetical protein
MRYRRSGDRRWLDRLRVAVRDPATCKDFAWTGLSGIVAFGLGLVAVTLWRVILGLITMPLRYWARSDATQPGIYDADTLPLALLTMVIGIVLIPVAGYTVRDLTFLELPVMEPLLRTGREQELEEPVEVLRRGSTFAAGGARPRRGGVRRGEDGADPAARPRATDSACWSAQQRDDASRGGCAA